MSLPVRVVFPYFTYVFFRLFVFACTQAFPVTVITFIAQMAGIVDIGDINSGIRLCVAERGLARFSGQIKGEFITGAEAQTQHRIFRRQQYA